MSGGRISPVETLSQTSSNATSNADDLQALQALSGWGTPSLFHITFLPSCSSTILPFIISPILFLSRISLPNAYSETTNLLPERTRSVLPEPFDSDSESDDPEVQLIAYMAEPSRKRACAAVEDSVNYDPGNKPSKPSGEQSARVIRQLQEILDRQV
ncbi:hypothetical protein ACHAPC_011084 [Botrytis cinerea]